jgi:methyl-accepting chemotaxis protein
MQEKTDSELRKEPQELSRSIAVRMHLVSPVLEELCSSISQSLSSTTEPLSAELLHIRQSSEDFLRNIHVYEDDVKNHTAINRLRDESSVFDRDLKSLAETVRSVFSTLEDHISNLRTVSDRIGGISADISEISEQIRILSFNASIEAARAGNAGAGFRVIAGEIKRLSSDTEKRLGEIRKTMQETRKLFGAIGTGLGENKARILDVVAQRQSGFSTLEQTLENYFPKLDELYTGVTEIIDSLTKSMSVISPVVQLHEITSQEIENMGRVATDLCTWTGSRAEKLYGKPASEPNKTEIETITADIRKRLTTETELDALGRGIRRSVPDADIDLGSNNRDIELF